MPVINKVSPHLHSPAGSRPLWGSQASSQRLPAVILCHSSYQIPRNWYHYRPVTCAMHSFQSFVSSFACRSSRLCFITWKPLVEDYLALFFCIFHSLCWLLSDLEELVSLRGSDPRRHSFKLFCIFFIFCACSSQILKNWYHYGVVTCGNILLHLLTRRKITMGRWRGVQPLIKLCLIGRNQASLGQRAFKLPAHRFIWPG